ncbi:cbb3-type cytochrome c oxidase subunit I [Tumebacillus permanentifrigoris]|uniref:Cytochrome c oxidase cbb3-type subunit 1 n=1 Tax=Tumebacillus permanentifrigoris TaxID=378543 RepID=A0A316DD09_9BACL|nr:cbb3-type cytochrome c oxidase subunit I [Tumebacillus permanentifrigoris]PWK15884.1 cytochrome c oxidase cbb3-type subunit 1 [Tumebacillus permanentifrigoris]
MSQRAVKGVPTHIPKGSTTVKIFFYFSIFYLLASMILGLIVSLKSVNPEFLTGNRFLQEYFTYGRLRPTHTNTALVGWLTTVNFGVLFYGVPALCKTGLWSEKLGLITAILWNVNYIGGAVSLLAGYQTGVEYAELPLLFDIGVVICVVLTFWNLFQTTRYRKERVLYVSMWYWLGSLLNLAIVYIVGNIPVEWIGSGSTQMGYYYFYLHNIVGLWFTVVGVGTIYYLLPKMVQRPIYSHKLSLIGFWMIIAFYSWNGPHHLVNGPIPLWLMKAGIIPSLLLLIPVWSVLANVIGTMKGVWFKVSQQIGLKFLITGALFYGLACIQGPFQALMGPHAILHFTYWTVGHAHMPLFGGFSMVAFSAIYYILPRITYRHIYSQTLMNLHYWLSVLGFLIFGFAMWTAGIIQGFEWMDGKQLGSGFLQVMESLHIFLISRAVGGSLMFLGQIAFAWNIYRSAKAGQVVTADDPILVSR